MKKLLLALLLISCTAAFVSAEEINTPAVNAKTKLAVEERINKKNKKLETVKASQAKFQNELDKLNAIDQNTLSEEQKAQKTKLISQLENLNGRQLKITNKLSQLQKK